MNEHSRNFWRQSPADRVIAISHKLKWWIALSLCWNAATGEHVNYMRSMGLGNDLADAEALMVHRMTAGH